MSTNVDGTTKRVYRRSGPVLQATVDADAMAVIRQHCRHNPRGFGKFISRLVLEHQARVDERRLRDCPEASTEPETSCGP